MDNGPRAMTAGQASSRSASMGVRGAAVWAMAGQYLGFAIQFVSSVVISRWFLGPADLGLFSIAMALALVIAVIQDFGMARHVAALPQLTRDDLSRSSTVAVVFALALASVIALVAVPAAHVYHQPGLVPILLIIAGSYLCMPLTVMPLAVLSRTMGFHGHFVVSLGGAVTQGGVAIALAAWGWGAASLAWIAYLKGTLDHLGAGPLGFASAGSGPWVALVGALAMFVSGLVPPAEHRRH